VLKLHGYQQVAKIHLRRNPRAALFLDMGLGKTAATLSALQAEHLPVLVIAPKRVAETVWDREATLWRPDLTVAVAAGYPSQRRDALLSGADVVVLGRDNIKDVLKYPVKWNTLVFDELSGFKNRGSQRWKEAVRIIRQLGVKNVWGLTGTPAPNGLMDLWSQVFLLDEGARLGKTLSSFRGRYFIPGRQLRSGVITEWLLRPGCDETIHSKLEDICLSMSAEGRLELPDVSYNRVNIRLPSDSRKVYDDLRKRMIAEWKAGVICVQDAAALSGKLSQVAAGFVYDGDLISGPRETYQVLHSEKMNAVQEIIDGTGSPVLVFYRFRAERELLGKAIKNARHISEPGIIDEWNAGEVPVLLAHPASAGHGLNLQSGGHTIVWTSMPWSLEEWEQGNKRLHRQGQKNPVIIHTVEATGTVDEIISSRLAGKQDVQNALLDHLESIL